jgi:hypothetical protein
MRAEKLSTRSRAYSIDADGDASVRFTDDGLAYLPSSLLLYPSIGMGMSATVAVSRLE